MLHHLAQAIGRASHRDVGNLAEGVALEVGQRGNVPVYHRRATFLNTGDQRRTGLAEPANSQVESRTTFALSRH